MAVSLGGISYDVTSLDKYHVRRKVSRVIEVILLAHDIVKV